MSVKIQVDSWDYKEAIAKVNELLDNETDIKNISGTEIVDLVIDICLN